MAFGPGRKPSREERTVTFAEIEEKAKEDNFYLSILDFLKRLDSKKTLIRYIKQNGTHHGNEGYEINHFGIDVPDPLPEFGWKHDVWATTWVGISAWMS